MLTKKVEENSRALVECGRVRRACISVSESSV